MMAATWCQDTQALGLVTRRQRPWEAQRWGAGWPAWPIISSCGAHSGCVGSQPPGGGGGARGWCGCSGTSGPGRASSGGGAGGWSVSASVPFIRSPPRSRKAFPPCFTAVCGWGICAKNWQLRHRQSRGFFPPTSAASATEKNVPTWLSA
jgi:hypothetical protein